MSLKFQESSSNKAPLCLHDALRHLHDLVSYQSEYPSWSICTSPARHSCECSTRQSALHPKATAFTTPLARSWIQVTERDIFVGVREYWKLCGIADRILNIQEYVEQLSLWL